MSWRTVVGILGLFVGLMGVGCKKSSDGGRPPVAGGAGAGGSVGNSGGGGDGGRGATIKCDFPEGGAPAVEVQIPWDWTGVVGTGQSLAVGQNGTPVVSSTQPYNNLQLSTGDLEWPIDPDDAALEMVPLIEPIGRRATGYPSSWPKNIANETIHSAMANQVTTLVMDMAGQDYVGVHGEFGENGQCMTYLEKAAPEDDVVGRAYEATLIATEAISRLAAAEGKTYGVGAITVVHGECDAGNTHYEDDLVQLWSDYSADIQALTGQTETIQMLVSQQNSINDRAASTLAQWQVGVNHPESHACVGPTYQYESSDGVHLTGDGYRELGEKFGQVYVERVVLGRDWQPLQPLGVERESSRVVSVKFHVPAPPLVWDRVMTSPHQSTPEWSAGKGFELRAGSRRLGIVSARIVCDAVEITADADLPEQGLVVSYALHADDEERAEPEDGMVRWGLLRDSDGLVGSTTEVVQPNYAVAFQLDVP